MTASRELCATATPSAGLKVGCVPRFASKNSLEKVLRSVWQRAEHNLFAGLGRHLLAPRDKEVETTSGADPPTRDSLAELLKPGGCLGVKGPAGAV